MIPLLSRFKNESEKRWHLMLARAETTSGFEPSIWVEGLLC